MSVYPKPLRTTRLLRTGRCADASPSIDFSWSGRMPDAPAIPIGTEIANFFIYLLGIMRGRSYDGGLSFLAKMQIDAEDGV